MRKWGRRLGGLAVKNDRECMHVFCGVLNPAPFYCDKLCFFEHTPSLSVLFFFEKMGEEVASVEAPPTFSQSEAAPTRLLQGIGEKGGHRGIARSRHEFHPRVSGIRGQNGKVRKKTLSFPISRGRPREMRGKRGHR